MKTQFILHVESDDKLSKTELRRIIKGLLSKNPKFSFILKDGRSPERTYKIYRRSVDNSEWMDTGMSVTARTDSEVQFKMRKKLRGIDIELLNFTASINTPPEPKRV